MEADAISGASLVWQGIARILDTFRQNVCILPRNGSSVRLRVDPWLPFTVTHLPEWLSFSLDYASLIFVVELVDPATGGWNRPLLDTLFSSPTVSHIFSLPPPNPLASDIHILTPDSRVNLGFQCCAIFSGSLPTPTFFPFGRGLEKLWSVPIQDRLKLLLWKVAAEALPVRVPSSRFCGLPLNPHTVYVLCGQQVETIVHLAFLCPVTRTLWRSSNWPLYISRI